MQYFIVKYIINVELTLICWQDLGTVRLLRFALDVVNGLQYLYEMNCVHRDLAAKNCLYVQ